MHDPFEIALNRYLRKAQLVLLVLIFVAALGSHYFEKAPSQTDSNTVSSSKSN